MVSTKETEELCPQVKRKKSKQNERSISEQADQVAMDSKKKPGFNCVLKRGAAQFRKKRNHGKEKKKGYGSYRGGGGTPGESPSGLFWKHVELGQGGGKAGQHIFLKRGCEGVGNTCPDTEGKGVGAV